MPRATRTSGRRVTRAHPEEPAAVEQEAHPVVQEQLEVKALDEPVAPRPVPTASVLEAIPEQETETEVQPVANVPERVQSPIPVPAPVEALAPVPAPVEAPVPVPAPAPIPAPVVVSIQRGAREFKSLEGLEPGSVEYLDAKFRNHKCAHWFKERPQRVARQVASAAVAAPVAAPVPAAPTVAELRAKFEAHKYAHWFKK